jgi:nucleotide-binding universal stress UspA family protein
MGTNAELGMRGSRRAGPAPKPRTQREAERPRRSDRSGATEAGGPEVFKRILVAMDSSDAARAAFVFVSDWARQFDAQVWFIQLTDESVRRRCEIVTDVDQRGRQLANQFTIRGATRSARNQQLVNSIAESAQTFRADLVVVGIDRHRLARGVREQLTQATNVPVLIPANPEARSTRVAVRPALPAIPLGPAPITRGAMAGSGALAHV